MNLPNKLFESLMAGVPVIVSEGNEQCRLVSDERVGSCVDVDDPGAIAAACADLTAQPDGERVALRTHCRQVALERYTWEGNASRASMSIGGWPAPMAGPVEAAA